MIEIETKLRLDLDKTFAIAYDMIDYNNNLTYDLWKDLKNMLKDELLTELNELNNVLENELDLI